MPVNHSPTDRGGPASQSSNISRGSSEFNAMELPKPSNYNEYEIFDGRPASHPTRSFDDTSNMDGPEWTVKKLGEYIQKARKNIMDGYGNSNDKTLLFTSGIYHYEILKSCYKEMEPIEACNIGMEIFKSTSGTSRNKLIDLAGLYRFVDIKIVTSNQANIDNYQPASKGFNPYRIDPHVKLLISNVKHGAKFLRVNEEYGVFHAPELEDMLANKINQEYMLKIIHLRNECLDAEQARIKAQRQMEALEKEKTMVTIAYETAQSEIGALRKENNLYGVMYRQDKGPRRNNNNEQNQQANDARNENATPAPFQSNPNNENNNRPQNGNPAPFQSRPGNGNGNYRPSESNNYRPNNNTGGISRRNKMWCNYCRAYGDHKAGFGFYGCTKMKKERPNACWKCGKKGHTKPRCKNKEVPGVAWVPGYEPKRGTQRRPPNPPRTFERRPTQVFTRTDNYMADLNKVVNDDEPDCVKIFANALSKFSSTEENILGDSELIAEYVRSMHTQEQDLIRRETDLIFGTLRRARAQQIDQEEAFRSLIVKNLSEEIKKDITDTNEDASEAEQTAVIHSKIVDKVNAEINWNLLSPDEIDEYQFIERKIKNPDYEPDSEMEEFVTLWHMKVVLFRRDLVLKITKRAKSNFPDGFDPDAPTEKVFVDECLTPEQIRNDAYVRTQISIRNDRIIEDKGSLAYGEWKSTGKRGVRRLIFKEPENPPEPEVDADSDIVVETPPSDRDGSDSDSSDADDDNPDNNTIAFENSDMIVENDSSSETSDGEEGTSNNPVKRKHGDRTPSTDASQKSQIAKKKKHKSIEPAQMPSGNDTVERLITIDDTNGGNNQ